MDKREKRSDDTRALLKDVANTRWLFYCPDKTVFMIFAQSSGWPKELSLNRKLSLQKDDKVQIRNPLTRKYHECSLIDKGTETYLRKAEAKGAQLISQYARNLAVLERFLLGTRTYLPSVGLCRLR